ncbi:MAG: hypothetical protein KAJ01_09900 [Candidatus Hydrogenedentes bacterium]|nr:hypothetical protein [Candidatus Hydrogenedentota bacterium]
MKNFRLFLLLVFSVVAALVIGLGAAGLMRLFSDVSGVPLTRDVIIGASCTLAGIFLGALYQKHGLGKKRY